MHLTEKKTHWWKCARFLNSTNELHYHEFDQYVTQVFITFKTAVRCTIQVAITSLELVLPIKIHTPHL